MPTTWNPNDKGSGIVLANNNLTALLPVSADQSVKSTTSKTTGKWYFEVRSKWVASEDDVAGIWDTTSTLTNFPGANANGYGIVYNQSQTRWEILHNGIFTFVSDTPSAWSIIGVCLDLSSNFIYYNKNGADLYGNPAAGTGGESIAAGTWYAAVGGGFGDANTQMTANFGATAFAFTPPSGFTAWDTSPFTYNTFGVSMTSITRVVQTVGI